MQMHVEKSSGDKTTVPFGINLSLIIDKAGSRYSFAAFRGMQHNFFLSVHGVCWRFQGLFVDTAVATCDN